MREASDIISGYGPTELHRTFMLVSPWSWDFLLPVEMLNEEARISSRVAYNFQYSKIGCWSRFSQRKHR